MMCPKCGSEISDNRCPNCGFTNAIMPENQVYNQQPATNQNEKLILIFGILSFFMPIFIIVTYVMGKGLNKDNNYGGSNDIKIGKTCAKVALVLQIVGIILWTILFVGMMVLGMMEGSYETTEVIETTLRASLMTPMFI